jgi:phospholipid/cholesterol/gamma-HCH transport system ATP-binding protein
VRAAPGPAAPGPCGDTGTVGEILRLDGVRVSFGDQSVLAGISFALAAGEHLAVLGRSGSGKSVLLRAILGLLPLDAGSVHLWGVPTTGLDDRGWAPLRRRCGFVFQAGALFDSLTVFENIAFPLRREARRSEAEIRDAVAERLEWVELPDAGARMPSELSGGMRRRVALARTLAGSPEFILYDEPTTGLDPLTARRISELIRDLGSRVCGASILVTHDLQSAQIVAGRWMYLANGRIAADGAPGPLRREMSGEWRAFIEAYGWLERESREG